MNKSVKSNCIRNGYRALKYGFILIMLAGMTNVAFGQTTNPISIELEGEDEPYYQHEYNSKSGGAITPDEKVEIVTKGAKQNYFVMPSQIANPGSFVAGEYDPNKVFSTFTWTVTGGGAVTVPSITPLVEIQWNTVTTNDELSSITVKEIPDSDGFCQVDDSETVIEVLIIKETEVSFYDAMEETTAPVSTKGKVEGTDTYEATLCLSDSELEGGITVTFPMDVDKADETDNVRVVYTLQRTEYGADDPDGPALEKTEPLVNDDSLEILFAAHGTYVITIKKITDRISRKATNLKDLGNLADGVVTFTLTLTKPVETGPIYRIPNFK